ncbi:hypothetical protein EQ500_00750 [Lactobacillus sp. XV13L]|nr:hypothetical protein [Lactobacillus sp. XV13L]
MKGLQGKLGMAGALLLGVAATAVPVSAEAASSESAAVVQTLKLKSASKKKQARYVNLNVPYISQNAVGAWMGCESAALLEGLHYKGVLTHMGLVQFMKHLPRSKNNDPRTGFAGSPYQVTRGVYQSIFPKPLAQWGNKYHPVKDISGASVGALRKQLQRGNPVVVYVTLNFAKARWGRYFWGKGIDNAHVMLLDGYDTRRKRYHVADPNRGKYWVRARKFARSYNYRRYAVAIQ